MENEVKERLRSLTRKMADSSFAIASDPVATEEEFEEAMDVLSRHLREIRKRTQGMSVEKVFA